MEAASEGALYRGANRAEGVPATTRSSPKLRSLLREGSTRVVGSGIWHRAQLALTLSASPKERISSPGSRGRLAVRLRLVRGEGLVGVKASPSPSNSELNLSRLSSRQIAFRMLQVETGPASRLLRSARKVG